MRIAYRILVLILCITVYNTVAAQTNKYQFDIGGGIGTSIGPTTTQFYQSTISGIIVGEYRTKRYRLPVVVIRADAWRQLSEKIKAGISSGINIHYLEQSFYGEYYTELTVPLQFGINMQMFKVNNNYFIESEIKSGFDFKKQNLASFYTEKGGSISSFAIVLNCKKNKSNSLLLKLGYELQFDKFYEEVYPSEYVKRETVINNVRRNTIFIMLSTGFN